MASGYHPEKDESAVHKAAEEPREFLLQRHPDLCRECWGCVRYCPTRAIRVIDGSSEIIEERCVKCGLCVSECGNCAYTVRDDTEAVRALLASGRPVVVELATEFVAALHPLTPQEIERTLEALGFYAVESTLLGEELVAAEYERSHSRPCASLTLRSTCPVVLEWVRKFYPTLVPALTPIVPPYVAQARLVKELYPENTAVVYISPCYARKDEIFEPEFAGVVDAALDFTELERMMAEAPLRPPLASAPGSRRPEPIKEISLTDGFPRRTLEKLNQTQSDVAKVRGLDALDELLSAVMRGEAAPAVVDMLNCEGCLDGPAVRPSLSVFAKRNIVAAERDARRGQSVSSRELLPYLPTVDLMRTFRARPVRTFTPCDAEIDTALATGGFDARDDVLDCGACGYPTCVEHAVAVIAGNSSWEMCFPLQRRRMREVAERLEASATVDALTRLGNRRVFDERLAEEAARTARYGSPLSLLMVDIDGFKNVNDTHGHVVGDRVLTEVSDALRQNLRIADVPTRYGGDEFALILPQTTKTEAWAVAEKLRHAVSAMRISVNGEDPKSEIGVTVSIGVASLGGTTTEAIRLLEAADSALYHAKQGGRDQVRISGG